MPVCRAAQARTSQPSNELLKRSSAPLEREEEAQRGQVPPLVHRLLDCSSLTGWGGGSSLQHRVPLIMRSASSDAFGSMGSRNADNQTLLAPAAKHRRQVAIDPSESPAADLSSWAPHPTGAARNATRGRSLPPPPRSSSSSLVSTSRTRLVSSSHSNRPSRNSVLVPMCGYETWQAGAGRGAAGGWCWALAWVLQHVRMWQPPAPSCSACQAAALRGSALQTPSSWAHHVEPILFSHRPSRAGARIRSGHLVLLKSRRHAGRPPPYVTSVAPCHP